MRKTFTILFFIILSYPGFSQGYDGVYRVDYIRSIETITSIDGQTNNADTRETISMSHGILEFKGQSVTVHNFVDEPMEAVIKNDRFLLNGVDIIIDKFNQDSVILKSQNEEEDFLVLKPFETGEIRLEKADFLNSQWKIETETSDLSSLKFHFSDSLTVINDYHGLAYGYANYGEWKLLQSGKYYLLNITDRENLKEFVFYFSSRSKDKIVAELPQENSLGEAPPILHNVSLVKQKLLTNEELLKKERHLLGTWSFVSFEEGISSYILDSLVSVNFTIEFNDNKTLVINNSFNGIIDSENVSYSNHENGNWKSSSTGSYITAQSHDNWTQYLSIYSLDHNTLILDLNYQYEKRSSFQARVKMKRNN